MLQKLVLLVTPEDKANKQQNQADHFSLATKTFPQIWSSAVNRFEVIKTRFSPVVTNGALSAVLLNYSSPRSAVALEKGHLPTTR